MDLILNTNNLGYKPFLKTRINSMIIGLKNFCINQPFSLSFKELTNAIKDFKHNEKKLYLSINIFAMEKDIKKLKSIVKKIKNMEIDGFIVSDLGVLNIFKENNLENKVILDLQTYVTNKYSSKSLLNLGVKRILLSKEITLDDIKEISSFNDNKVELLVQGYYPITYSKRPILNCYYKNFKLKNKNDLHFIKEESRNEYYYLLESKNNLTVYNSKQYSLFNYLPELIENKINYFRIDSIFLKEEEIKEYIEMYKCGIEYINNNELEKFENLKQEYNRKYTFDTPFLHNESFLLKEGK